MVQLCNYRENINSKFFSKNLSEVKISYRTNKFFLFSGTELVPVAQDPKLFLRKHK